MLNPSKWAELQRSAKERLSSCCHQHKMELQPWLLGPMPECFMQPHCCAVVEPDLLTCNTQGLHLDHHTKGAYCDQGESTRLPEIAVEAMSWTLMQHCQAGLQAIYTSTVHDIYGLHPLLCSLHTWSLTCDMSSLGKVQALGQHTLHQLPL